ncbi:MAG: glycoside hydrolase family 2 TIM barrel-domain containing protein [Opitutales bacterium]
MNLIRIATLTLVSIFLALASTLSAENLREGWEFVQKDLGSPWEALRTEKRDVDNPRWTSVTIPHTYNAYDVVSPYEPYYQGPAWYRLRKTIKNPHENGTTLLHFRGAGQKTQLYIEDHFVGEHVGGFDEFSFDITEALAKFADRDAVSILVRTDNSRDVEMMPSNLADFHIYGGLYREVHLEYLPELYVEWPRMDALVDEAGKKGTIKIRARIQDKGERDVIELLLELFDEKGHRVKARSTRINTIYRKFAEIEIELDNPKLWSPDSPYLYTWKLKTRKLDNDTPHVIEGTTGFRYFRFEKKGPFYLNGERLLLRGTHRHEDHAGYGFAMPDDLLREEMQLMKDMGVNFLRLGHYQQDRQVLELCDELGILVWEEIPWCRGGIGGEEYQEQGRRMMRNMIAQHRHHPSIILWGIGNETDWKGDFSSHDRAAVREYSIELHELAKWLDPHRMTALRRNDDIKGVIDVYSPSIWSGWYHGKFTDYFEVTKKRVQSVDHFFHAEWGASQHARRHSEDPDKGLAAIESGDGTERDGDFLMTGGAARVSRDGDWTESYAVNLIDWFLKEQEKMPWLTGSAAWLFKDFTTAIRSNNPVPYVNQKGVVERDMTPKAGYYVFQSYWAKEPMLRIYGHTWPVRWGEEGEAKMLKVYSNCDTVELFLNGKSLGKRERESQNFPAAGLRWVSPFKVGKNTVKAVAVVDGKELVDEIEFEYQTKKWGKPAKLEAKILSEDAEMAWVQVYALDANGVRCLDSKARIHFELAGDGKLIADLGTSRGSRSVQMYNGRAEISLEKRGGISFLTAKSKGLPTAYIKVE